MNLFDNEKNTKPEIIRSLGFYQPFGSLMLHGKIETRWIRAGKKPPFPLGKYVFYTTLKSCAQHELFNWCGEYLMLDITHKLLYEPTKELNGYAIAIGDLAKVRPMKREDTFGSYVQYKGLVMRIPSG